MRKEMQIRRFVRDLMRVDGQDLIEYGLLALILSLAVIVSTRRVGRDIGNALNNIGFTFFIDAILGIIRGQL